MDLTFRNASLSDHECITPLIRAFYKEESLVFPETTLNDNLNQLLGEDGPGFIFLARESGNAVGYAVLTLGFSIEFGGKFLLLDELYLVPAQRGIGNGRLFLEFLCDVGLRTEAKALRLEALRTSAQVAKFYTQFGFVLDSRDLMTKRLV